MHGDRRWRLLNTSKTKSSLLESLATCLHHPGSSQGLYARLLRLCGEVREVTLGKRLHGHIVRFGYEQGTFLGNLLVQMYGQCGRILDARLVFEALQVTNVFSETILFGAYAQNGRVEDARVVFQGMSRRDAVAWNAMIALHGQCGEGKQACKVFWWMNLEGVRWTESTLVSVVGACSTSRQLEQLLALAGDDKRLAFSSTRVGNAMVTVCSKCGKLTDSIKIFQGMKVKDVVSWNALIAAFVRNSQTEKALVTYRKMRLEGVSSDCVTYVTVLEACSELEDGKSLHTQIDLARTNREEESIMVATGLITMYGRCGSPLDARNVFDELASLNDVVSWSAMIAAYVRSEYYEQAVELFRLMDVQGSVKPNHMTLSSVLDACAGLQDVKMGTCLAKEAERYCCSEFDNLVLSTAIVHMFSKCGKLEQARTVFASMAPRKNVVCWNAMMAGCALNGDYHQVMEVWRVMEVEGVGADEATFVNVLSSCSHSGELHQALSCFSRLSEDHWLTPKADHVACVVDMLGRLGFLEEAELMISRCLSSLDNCSSLAWLTLLGACRTHRDVGRGTRAARNVNEMVPEKSAPYLLLCSIYTNGD